MKKKQTNTADKNQDYITILYDKEDALNFNKYKNTLQKKIYVFSPNIKLFLKNIKFINLNVFFLLLRTKN